MRQVKYPICHMLNIVLLSKTSFVILVPSTCLSVGLFHHYGTPAMYAVSP